MGRDSVICCRTCTSSALCLPGLAAPTSSGRSHGCSLPHAILKNTPRTCWPGKLYCIAMTHLPTTVLQKTWGNYRKSEPLWGWVFGKSLELYFHPALSAVGLWTSSEKMLINDSALGTPTDVKEEMYPLKKIWWKSSLSNLSSRPTSVATPISQVMILTC